MAGSSDVMLPLGSLRAIMQQTNTSDDDATTVLVGKLDIAFNPVSFTTEASNISEKSMSNSDPPAEAVPPMTPDELCHSYCVGLDNCQKSGQGSYCKTANSPNICFALYWKVSEDGSKVACYASDGDCPETDPVLCDLMQEGAPVI